MVSKGKNYYIRNRGKILEKKKEYYQKNKEPLKEKMKVWGARWYQNNIEKARKAHREYYKNNKGKESKRHKILYIKNREKYLEQSKNRYLRNRKSTQKRHREYNKNNKEKILIYKNVWQKKQRKTNPKWRLDENMGSAIARSMQGLKSGQTWKRFVNYTLKDLTEHLENQFDKKMNWKNYGSYWAIDHIKPRSLFTYTSTNDSEFKECWDLKNLQPLEKIENIKKGNRYIG